MAATSEGSTYENSLPITTANEIERLNVVLDHDMSSELAHRLDRIMESSSEDGLNKPMALSWENFPKKINKVPDKFRQIESNKSSFDPSVVSIGPYHHGKIEFKPMEEFKKSLTRRYVNKTKSKSIHLLYKEVEKLTRDTREYYAEDSTQRFNDEDFAMMIMLDGCFVLQFMECMVKDKRSKMKMKDSDIAYVQQDLFLLENQLPFGVLDLLIKMRYDNKIEGLRMINKFIKIRLFPLGKYSNFIIILSIILIMSILEMGIRVLRITVMMSMALVLFSLIILFSRRWLRRRKKERETLRNPPVHLLDLMWRDLTNALEHKAKRSTKNDWYSFRSAAFHSAKELKRAKIYFLPTKTHHGFTDVKFETHLFRGGILKLPGMIVDDSTKSLFLNLIVLEDCLNAPTRFVTGYICLIKSLISDPDNLEEMRSAGILENRLGNNEDMTKLITEVTAGLVVPDIDTYVDVKNAIGDYFRETGRIKVATWMAEMKEKYFSSPWSAIAVLAAIVALILSILQTHYTIHPRPDKCNESICQYLNTTMRRN